MAKSWKVQSQLCLVLFYLNLPFLNQLRGFRFKEKQFAGNGHKVELPEGKNSILTQFVNSVSGQSIKIWTIIVPVCIIMYHPYQNIRHPKFVALDGFDRSSLCQLSSYQRHC